VLRPRRAQVEQHIPSRVGEQIWIEKTRTQLPLPDNMANQPGIGQRWACHAAHSMGHLFPVEFSAIDLRRKVERTTRLGILRFIALTIVCKLIGENG